MKSNKTGLWIAAMLAVVLSACSTATQTAPTFSVQQAVATLVAMTFEAATHSASKPAATNAPAATPTLSAPIFYVNGNVACRTGTGQNFRALVTFTPGTTVEMLGKDPSGNYWLVKIPGGTQTCWLQTIDGTPGGDYERLPAVTPQPSTQKPPGVPANLAWPFYCEYEHDVIYKVTIKLSWADLAQNANGFRLYRQGTQIADLPATTTTFTDAVEVMIGSQLSYAVEAYNDAGTSPRQSVTINSICK